ncbi:MAG: hypothetical protein L0229_07425 [Blastocatellia bacterium]|nr:hypothetical protein [Blastocatellia bacterium]
MNCPKCERPTPAARANCLYCGEALPVTEIETAPPQRNIDHTERAFNTVLEPSQTPAGEQTVSALAGALTIEPDEARAFISAARRLPLARSQTHQEAALVAALVRSCGLRATVVADEDLELELELTRARRITRVSDELKIHHSGGVMAVPCAEIKLLVFGALRNLRVDYTEGMPGLRGQTSKMLDATEFRAEETLLDVYAADLEKSFRIRADGFDYSGLVEPLSYRAELNFRAALKELQSAASSAAFDEDFARVRALLSRAWPERSRIEARGLRRAGFARRPVARSSMVSDNRDQFDRYSRLMFLSIKP